jgi:Tfp pilus assembly protein PilO
MWVQLLMILAGLLIVAVGFIFLLRSADKQLSQLKKHKKRK